MMKIKDDEGNEAEVVTFIWTTKHGHCYDCGLPAAFRREYKDIYRDKLCAVCAANAACDGETIVRIEED